MHSRVSHSYLIIDSLGPDLCLCALNLGEDNSIVQGYDARVSLVASLLNVTVALYCIKTCMQTHAL